MRLEMKENISFFLPFIVNKYMNEIHKKLLNIEKYIFFCEYLLKLNI